MSATALSSNRRLTFGNGRRQTPLRGPAGSRGLGSESARRGYMRKKTPASNLTSAVRARALSVRGRGGWKGSSERELKGTHPIRLRPLVSRCKNLDEPRASELIPNTAHLGSAPSELSWKQDSGCTGRNLDLRTHVPCKRCRRFVLVLCASFGFGAFRCFVLVLCAPIGRVILTN